MQTHYMHISNGPDHQNTYLISRKENLCHHVTTTRTKREQIVQHPFFYKVMMAQNYSFIDNAFTLELPAHSLENNNIWNTENMYGTQ